jgi:hypothetical protein
VDEHERAGRALGVGVAPDVATKLAGADSIEFEDGRYRTASGYIGTYRVDGDTITFVFGGAGAPGAPPGDTSTMRYEQAVATEATSASTAANAAFRHSYGT